MMIMTSSNKDIHTTKESFLVAAASYFGLPDGQVMQGSTVEVGADGTLDVVLRVSLTPDDLTGIAGRMAAMAEEQANQQVPAPASVYVPGWTREELREQYNALSKQERSQYGSFARYEAWRRGLDPHNTPEVVEKVELPAYVYLSPAEATPQQKAMAIGQDEKGNYAIAVEDLTADQYAQAIRDGQISLAIGSLGDELNTQTAISKERVAVTRARAASDAAMNAPVAAADQLRAAYVERTMGAHARLNGTDGKPTSNADDFGGVPG